MNKEKHGQTIAHDKVGNLCCQGCFMLGKSQAIKDILEILNDLDNLHQVENDCCCLCKHKLGFVIDVDELKETLEALK